MTTNKEWLFSLPLEEQYAWMNAEHYEANPDCSPMIYQAYTGNMMADGSSDESCESESGFWTVARWLDGPLSGDDDSREKLEAEIDEWCAEHFNNTTFSGKAYNLMLRWLDRQAAITRLESLYQFGENHRHHIRELEDVIEELNNRIAELTTERDELADELLKTSRERETYRKLLSRAIDNAFDTTQLMDEGLA